MLLVIDNYDSFTYNLVQYFGELHAQPKVWRNDRLTVAKIRTLRPKAIVISPGPGSPKDAGISNEVIEAFSGSLPILGVCLGHQCIGHVFGGKIVRARQIMHGKTSDIYHGKKGVFRGLPDPFRATRYHSLILEPRSVPACLEVTAKTSRGEIMGVQHRRHPTFGVQFHPESILTDSGKELLLNFLKISGLTKGRNKPHAP